jgi:outer membrane protein
MRTFQQTLAIFCAALMLAPMAMAQDAGYSWQTYEKNKFIAPYSPRTIAPINLTNSPRLDQLLRAGKLYLSLKDAIALALENNLDVELSRYGPQIAAADLLRAEAGGLLRGVPQTVNIGPESIQQTALGIQSQGARGGTGGGGGDGTTSTEAGGAVITQTGVATPNLDPTFFTRYGWGHRTNPLSNTITTGTNSLVFENHSWNVGIQKSWLTGTEVSGGWNSNRIKTTNTRSDLNPTWDSDLQVRVTQRLLQGWGKAVNGRNIKIAKNNLRVSDIVFQQQVIATVTSTVKLYWDLVAFAEDVKVKNQALALAEKLYSDNKKQVEIGTLAPIEITSAEAQVARRQQELTSSETRLMQQETVIKNSLSRTGVFSPALATARIVTTDRLPVPDAEGMQQLGALVDSAMSGRPEIEQNRINLENTKIGMAGSKSQLKPSLDAQAFYNHNSLSGDPNPLWGLPGGPNPDQFFVGGYGTALKQLFRRNFPDYGFGVQLSIPIGNRSAQADYIRDSLQLRRSEIQERQLHNNIRVQVENAVIAATQAKAVYDAAIKERQLQQETLDAEQKKYALGASTVFFVIQYQRDLAQAQSNEVQAVAAFAKAKVDLEQAIGRTLSTYNVNIDEARAGIISRPADIPAAAEQP